MLKKDICNHVERFAINFTDAKTFNLQATLVNSLHDKAFYFIAWKLPLHVTALIDMMLIIYLHLRLWRS